tara:strand:+ start:749 stop:2227 length:1479 start_codon:yes stop_codon:yes gene_type:complete
MFLLCALPQDLLKKILHVYLKQCDGTPVVWRLVCKELRGVAAHEPMHCSVQHVGVSMGLVRMLRGWIEHMRPGPRKYCSRGAFPRGRLDFADLVAGVVRYNNVRVLHELMQGPWPSDCPHIVVDLYNKKERQKPCVWCHIACGSGALESLKLLASAGCYLDLAAWELAAVHGHAHVVEWLLLLRHLRERGKRSYRFRAGHPIANIERDGKIALADQLEPLEEKESLFPLGFAVISGHLPIVKMLCSWMMLGEDYDMYDIYEAIVQWCGESRQLEVLKWTASQMGDDFSRCAECVCFEAAYLGDVPMLKWLMPQFPEYLSSVSRTAFQSNPNDLQVVQFLVEELHMQLTPDTMLWAILSCRMNDTAIMNYFYSKGCPSVHSTQADCLFADEYQCAARQERKTSGVLMQWLYDHDYVVPVSRGDECMIEAMKSDCVDVVKHLVECGVRFDSLWYGSEDYYMDRNKYAGSENWESSNVVAWARKSGYDVPAYRDA